MPSYVPRGLEPYQEQELFEKRVDELRTAVRSNAPAAKLAMAAEKVRAAALAVIKAKRSIIASHPASQTGLEEHPQGKSLARQLEHLERESQRWLSFSVDEIATLYSTSNR